MGCGTVPFGQQQKVSILFMKSYAATLRQDLSVNQDVRTSGVSGFAV